MTGRPHPTSASPNLLLLSHGQPSHDLPAITLYYRVMKRISPFKTFTQSAKKLKAKLLDQFTSSLIHRDPRKAPNVPCDLEEGAGEGGSISLESFPEDQEDYDDEQRFHYFSSL